MLRRLRHKLSGGPGRGVLEEYGVNRSVTTVVLGGLATLSGGAALGSMTASSAAGGSTLLVQAETILARQSVVTGATGAPISVDISRGIALASLPAIPTPAVAISGVAAPALSAATPKLVLQSQTVTPVISPQIQIGTTQQASFVISGDQDLAVSIAIPTSVPLAKVGGGGDVEFATTSSLGGSAVGQSRLSGSDAGSGQLAFDVGGHVEMKQNVLAGAYAGVLRVTVQYN